MSVFDKYTIDEISKRTKISPISLRYIRNKEFNKIPRVKFIGFIKLIQREFKEDMREWIEEYDSKIKPESQTPQITYTTQSSKNNNLLLVFALIILGLGGYLLYKTLPKEEPKHIKPQNITQKHITQTKQSTPLPPPLQKKQTTDNKPPKPVNESKPLNQTASAPKKEENSTITIIPHSKLWFRVVNLKTNKIKEYLTNEPKTFKDGNYFFKFGHGDFTFEYKDKNLTPKGSGIVKMIVKDGNYTILKRNL
ncbi:MAG: hypothetical protein GXO62_04310 [Epsilonproteobacteria bacterium]|nr:hypothetical protein [Campylobacterota bacterium]